MYCFHDYHHVFVPTVPQGIYFYCQTYQPANMSFAADIFRTLKVEASPLKRAEYLREYLMKKAYKALYKYSFDTVSVDNRQGF